MGEDKHRWGSKSPEFVNSIDRTMRKVVRRRVRPGDVDDVVQDTWVELLSARTDVDEPLPFAAVVAAINCAKHRAVCAKRSAAMVNADMNTYPWRSRCEPDVRAWIPEVLLPLLSKEGLAGAGRGQGVTPLMFRVLAGLASGVSSIKELARKLGTQSHRIKERLRSLGEKSRMFTVPHPTT